MSSLAPYNVCDHTVLSLGAGVQSSAIAVMAYSGDYGIPRPDSIYFADTGNEPQYVYDWLDILEDWLEDRGGTVNRVQKGNLREDTLEKERFASMPVWTMRDGKERPLRRQCTREYKIEVIEKAIKNDLGYKKGQHIKGKVQVGIMLGISVDEVSRAKQNSRTSWTLNLFPLLDVGYSRSDCQKVFPDHDLPVPKKSSCYFCPYHDDSYWRDLKENHPEEFQKAVEFDKQIRDMSMQGVENKVYLHRSCEPLGEIDFEEEDQPSLLDQSCGAFCGV